MTDSQRALFEKLCEKLVPGKQGGVSDWGRGWDTCCNSMIDGLKLFAAEAVEVRTSDGSDSWFSSTDDFDAQDTHRTWVFPALIEPIEKGVTKEEIIEALEAYATKQQLMNLADRIRTEGIKP